MVRYVKDPSFIENGLGLDVFNISPHYDFIEVNNSRGSYTNIIKNDYDSEKDLSRGSEIKKRSIKTNYKKHH